MVLWASPTAIRPKQDIKTTNGGVTVWTWVYSNRRKVVRINLTTIRLVPREKHQSVILGNEMRLAIFVAKKGILRRIVTPS